MADPEKPRRRRRAEPEAPPVDEADSEAEPEAEAEEPIAPVAKRKGERLPELEERAPRQALMLGGGLLIVGLGIVGTGLGGMGSVVALVGLAAIIYGIHAFGRLGGEDLTPTSAEAVARSSASVRLVLGVVIATVGLAVAVAGYLGLAPAGSIETAVIAFVAGGFLALRATMKLAPAKKTRRAA
jgi:hypothetical protein